MTIYNLQQEQVDALSVSVSNDKSVFVPEPNPMGTYDEQKQAYKEMTLMHDLVDLGLFKDVTGEFNEQVELFRSRYGYGIRFYMATEHGKMMFNPRNQVVN